MVHPSHPSFPRLQKEHPMKTVSSTALVVLALAAAIFTAPAMAEEKPHRLEACKADVQKFCADVPRGQGKMRACLDANKDKLSAECKTAREQAAASKPQ
jgi:hypothetical protein